MRTRTLVALTLAIAGVLASPAYAQKEKTEFPEIQESAVRGKPLSVHAHRSDVVVELDNPGGCSLFHIQRTNANFKELTAVALTAFSAVKRLTLFFDGLGDCPPKKEPIVTHGYVEY